MADIARRPKRVYIVDAFFGQDTGRLKCLVGPLADMRKEYTIDVRSEAAKDEGKLKLYREMGVRRVNIGVESLSPSILKAMRKGQSPEQVRHRLTKFEEHGFEIRAYVILGMPDETAEDRQETLQTARKLDVMFPNIEWFPNVFCELKRESSIAHHFSSLQADKLGIPREILNGWIELADCSRARAKSRQPQA